MEKQITDAKLEKEKQDKEFEEKLEKMKNKKTIYEEEIRILKDKLRDKEKVHRYINMKFEFLKEYLTIDI